MQVTGGTVPCGRDQQVQRSWSECVSNVSEAQDENLRARVDEATIGNNAEEAPAGQIS